MLPRTAFHENGLAEAPHTSTPLIPPASPARIREPTLPGSCTSTAISTKPFSWRQISSASIGFPPGNRHDPGRGADRTHRGECRIGKGEDSRAVIFGSARDVGFFGACDAGRDDCNRFELEARRHRFTDQVSTVEQQPCAGRVGLTRELTECTDDRVLAAVDDGHLLASRLVAGSW